MKILLVPWMLLLFGASLSSGHYIRDPEHGSSKVYQVHEGPSGVTFVNPKPGQPTLREILYYHIIERPREEPAITERSFTNSHGYQFLEPESLSEEYDEEEGEADHYDDLGHMEDENEFIEDKDSETREEEEPETTTEAKPLTDEDVKEAYKTRSYLFDQMRQRYAVKRMAVPDSLNRKKRQAEMQPLPEAPSFSNKDFYVLPKTYGMNLNPEGGYVWNNLNKPPSYYELGPSNGNSNEGQYPTAQSQENIPLPSENAYIPPETSNSGSSEDIYVNTNRPSAMPLETQPEPANPLVNDNTELVNNNPVTSDSGPNYPVEPILVSDDAVTSEGFSNNPIRPEVTSDSGANYPVEPVLGNDEAESNEGIANNPIGPEVYENPEQSYPVEPIVESTPEESAEGEKIKEMPEAPTLPPLNYDNLPDYIRDAISSTDKPGQYPTVQSQENIQLPSENAYIPPETSNSGSSEDLYVNTNRPSTMPLETQPEPANPEVNDNPELVNNNPVTSDSGATYPVEPILVSDDSVPNEGFSNNPIGPEVASDGGANYPVEPVLGNDEAESNEGIANNPIAPEVYEKPEQSYPVEPIVNNSGLNESPISQEAEVPQPETPISEGSAEPVGESNENPAYGYGQSEIEEPKVESTPEESAEGDKIKEMPEAQTLPPLNYDNLPDYIRDAISSTDKPASYEQTENPYINPQPSPDDKKAMEDKMEDIFATMPPVEDIPKTYGMNLTSGGGHVWNDMVNPPVSYDVGTPSNPEEEHKEEQTQPPIIEQPEIHKEPENPIPEPAQPATEEPIANPEEPNQEPETHESEETHYPIKEPNPPPKPENEGELEEPIANPNQEFPESEQEPEPEIPEIEDKPIEEPTEPEVIPGNPELIPENPEVIPENPELIPEPANENNPEIEVTEQPGDEEEPGEENGDHLEEPEIKPVQEIPEKENNKPDIMSELLKSEQFWKWLGEWTATYMELLEKHIRKIAIQEICKREKSGEQMCPLDDKPEDTGVIIKDEKIIVDGREIDMTHTDNLDTELRRHQNNKHENKFTNENKIEASTIYGNSVGNEKVTNVFIFTADKAEEVIDKLKPTNDSEVDFVIDDKIKEEDKGEPNKEKSIEDESNVEEANKESNEGVNKEEPNKEESDKESNEGEATSEVIKEGANEGETNKESTVPEANTEDLNSEEAKKESNEGEAAKEELDKEESKESDVSEANKDDPKIESNEKVTEEDSNKKKNIDSKPETDEEDLSKDEESKGSGDIGELDDKADDESKQESSEKNTNDSKEFLKKK